MNQDSLSFTLTQISYLVSNLNKKNFTQNSRQLALLVKPFGLEADRHLLRCLFSNIDFGDSIQVSKNSLHAKLLTQELTAQLNKSSLITNICFAIDNCFSHQKSLKPTANFLNQISRALSCSPILEVVIALALTHSTNPDFARIAENQIKIGLTSLIQQYVEIDTIRPNQEGGLNDISPELLQLILSLLSHGKYKKLGLSEVVFNKFIGQLARDFPRDRVPLILAPLIYTEDTEISAEKMSANSQGILTSAIMDTSWPNLVMDIGYSFTASVEECKTHLINTGREIVSQDVAKIIALMCRTHTNLSDCSVNLPTPSNAFWQGGQSVDQKDKAQNIPATISSTAEHATWKPDIFVQALKEVAANINWTDVCFAFDHREFLIKDRIGLTILITTVRLGMQSSGVGQHFPVDCICSQWKNAEGQLSLISMIIKSPDIYSFADHIYKSVQIESLKTPPEVDNKEIASWKSIHLVEALLTIAEQGFYTQVLEHFKTPLQHCPDILFMALLQAQQPMTVLRQELFTSLVPIFLGNHPNSGTILHHAWNSSNFNPQIRHIIMHSMSEWYIRGDYDQSKLSRILEVSQELKALSNLLNARSFMFVIDLACLASRREYLKLEKWLSDKIREHGEPFVHAIVKFLQRRCPQITGKIVDDQIPKAAQLPFETLSTMLSCLQGCAGNVQQELSEIIMTMTSNCNMFLSKTKQPQQPQPPPNVLRSHRGLEAPFSTPNLGGMFAGSDSIAALGSTMAGLNLGGPANAGAFNFNNVMNNIVSTPASPSRLLQAPSNSPFPMMSLATAPPVNNLGRIPATPTGEKLPITNQSMPNELVPKEVEDEANSYFQQIYNHPPHATLSIDEVLDMLQRFQDSPIRRERDVYQCMLRNLFEEYRFFPNYPDKELITTAQLFGGMIDRNLCTYVPLGLALRCVLDALRKPENSKMYFFGITALDRFKTKLHLYQKYCEHIKSIAHFNSFPDHIIEYVEYGSQSQEPPNTPQGQLMPASLPRMITSSENPTALYRDSARTMSMTPKVVSVTPNPTAMAQASRNIKSIANATNINTLLVATADRDEKIILPPDTVQDKTAFIFNNLSQLNLQQKCDEMKEILIKDYYAWLSQYLVLKRASIEINFHVLYSNFLDALKIPDIVRLVTKESFRNIRVLLRAEKGAENFSDRTLLKNLGHWLGMMTLGRNRPILQIDLDLKSLIVEAYHKSENELLYVVPFVAKVLESCAKSRVFKPPNPWTMGIMNVLAELHQEPDLKLNLKFEIEVLCKNFNIDVANLKPAVYLKDTEKALHIEYQLSQPKHQKELQAQQQQQQQQQIQSVMSGPVINDDIVTPTSVVQSTVSNVSPIQSLDSSGTIAMPIEPRYSYMDISVTSISNLAQHIVFSPNIAILHTQPQLKQLVRQAIERTITEWINPVVERSVRIGVNISEQLIRKDFALDPDESRMRTAAHYMVRNLTASMAMITCKDQLLQSITANIKTAFQSALAQHPTEMINEAVNQLAMDNAELACAFIQKTAIEKAIPDIDKRLTPDFDMRKITRPDRRYYDPSVLAYQSDRMPEQIKLKVGGVDSSQFAVYEEFARNIPGFQAMSERDAALFIPKATLPDSLPVPFNAIAQSSHGSIFGPDEFGVLYEELGAKMEAFLNNVVNIPALQVQLTNMHALFEFLVHARRNRDNLSAINLLNKAVEGLLEGLVSNTEHMEQIKLYRDIHLRALRLLQDGRAFGAIWTNRAITKCMIECREDIRYNLEAVDVLISSNFVNLNQYDMMLAGMMDSGSHYVAVAFAMQLIQHYLVDERPSALVTENDFPNTIDLLYRLSTHPRAPEGLAHLIEMLRLTHDPNTLMLDRTAPGPTQHIHSGILQVRSSDEDPPDFREKAECLLKEWVSIYHAQASGRDPIKSFGVFVNRMTLYGILKTDDLITRFFRQATQICIDLAYRNLSDPTIAPQAAKTKVFQCIDAFVRLIALIVKHSGETGNSTTKVNLLNKILGIVVGVLLQDQELHGAAFQQLGYHRLFIMLFLELTAPEPILENISLSVVTAFCHTYHILKPSVAPGFCYSWLELISHRVFIGRILAMIPQQKGWSMYSQLLMDLFKYLAPFLRNAELAKPVQLLYKGTLRVLLVLLHDFPEFLCDYHFGFCDVIPPNCIQMRNLILAAFPRNMRLPDPFTPNLKVDMLSEIATAPRIFTNYAANIHPLGFKKDLDSYLKARAPVTFLSELRGHLQISNEPGSRYNVALMNSLVLYVGIQAITHIRSKNLVPNMTTIVHSAHMDIFQNLAVDLDNEGRYLFLNAIANQLRYPNSHTHYFSCVLLYLFVETNSEAIQEQITRVLLERLIVNRPHPWGLLITFIELIKNPGYKFWEHDFVHCAPEIEKLFESVARSCMVVKSNNHQQMPNENDLQECN